MSQSSYSVTRRFVFDAAHRVVGHEGKCRNLHGHRYVAFVTVAPKPELDNLGRLIDFTDLKTTIGRWIEEHWDHNTILHPDDPILREAQSQETESEHAYLHRLFGQLPYVMPAGKNPTAEHLAERLYYIAGHLLCYKGLLVSKVKIYETENCFAEFTAEGCTVG